MKNGAFDWRMRGFQFVVALALTAAIMQPGLGADSGAEGDVSLTGFPELSQRAASLLAQGALRLDQAVAVLGGEITKRGGNDERGGSRWVEINESFGLPRPNGRL